MRLFRKKLEHDFLGFSFLEVMVAMSIFVVVLVQIGSVWSSFDRWVKYITVRANVRREAKIAREVLLGDLVNAKDTSLAPPDGLRIITDDESPDDVITYTKRGSSLLRLNDKTGAQLLVATFLTDIDFAIKADDTTEAILTFRSGVSESTLNIVAHPELE